MFAEFWHFSLVSEVVLLSIVSHYVVHVAVLA